MWYSNELKVSYFQPTTRFPAGFVNGCRYLFSSSFAYKAKTFIGQVNFKGFCFVLFVALFCVTFYELVMLHIFHTTLREWIVCLFSNTMLSVRDDLCRIIYTHFVICLSKMFCFSYNGKSAVELFNKR